LLLRKIFGILKLLNRIRSVIYLAFFSIVSGLSEFVSIASIVWALDKYSKGGVNDQLCIFDVCLNIEISANHLLIVIAGLIVLAYVIRLANGIYIHYLALLIGREASVTIASNLYGRNKYEFDDEPSSAYVNLVIVKINMFVRSILVPLFSLSSSFVYSAILIFISLGTNSELTLMILLGVSMSYLLIYFILRFKLTEISKSVSINTDEIMKQSYSIFNLYEEVKLTLNRSKYFDKLVDAFKKLNTSFLNVNILQIAPRYILEAIAILLVLYYFSVNYVADTKIIDLAPTFITLYIMQKLLPQGQLIFNGFTQLKSNSVVVNEIYEALHERNTDNSSQLLLSKDDRISYYDLIGGPLKSSHIISLKELHISFSELLVVKGESGSGKSTLIFSLLGLLPVSKANFFLAGSELPFNHNILKGNVSYLSQRYDFETQEHSKLLSFHTFSESNKILVIKLINNLNLHSLDLLNKNSKTFNYDKLSGGQRQRLKLLYKIIENKKIIICDEPTSALDLQNRLNVRNVLLELSMNKLVIVITHDKIFDEVANQIIEVKAGVAKVVDKESN